MQEVKNFSSGVLTNGGAIQRVQEREAKRERERLEKEAYEKHAAESAARRNKAREDRAIELAEQSKARQAAEEEKQRKAAEKSAREEEERLKVVAAKETARLTRQQDLERRLAENKVKEATKQAAAEVAALLANQQELERQNRKQPQAAALLDDLGKAPDALKTEASKPVVMTKEIEESEDLEELEELEAEEPLLQIVKGAVHVPASIPTMDTSVGTKTELPSAYDMSALMPAPAVLTVEATPQSEVQVEGCKELIDRILTGAEQAPEDQEQTPQSARSENRFQKIINTNRDLVKENQSLRARIEKLLDEVHGYQVEGELVGSILDTQEHVQRQASSQNAAERYLKPRPFNVVDEAKKEMLKYLSTREDEVDHTHKSVLFLKYMQDPFYMNVFVQNNRASEWWPVIDSIYNSIGLPAPDWSKSKIQTYQHKIQPQPIRARTATLGSPVANSGQPMDRIAQHLGNMGI